MGKRLLTLIVAVVCAVAMATPAAAASPISSAAQLLHLLHARSGLQERMFEEAEASGAEYVRVDVELHGIFGAGRRPARLDATSIA